MAAIDWFKAILGNWKTITTIFAALLSMTGFSTWSWFEKAEEVQVHKEVQKSMVEHIEYVNEHYVLPNSIKHEIITTNKGCSAECKKIIKELVNDKDRKHVRKFHE